MKKPFYLVGLAALALVGCSDNDFFSGGPDDNFGQASKGQLAFGISDGSGKTTRGEITGESAATKLGNKFTVYGWKYSDGSSTGGAYGEGDPTGFHDVFQDYVLAWKGINSKGTTESNVAGWEYVGEYTNPIEGQGNIFEQTIKYWDWSTNRYDFIAWTVKEGSKTQLLERPKITGTTPSAQPSLKFYAPTASSLAGVYVSDKFTSTKEGEKPTMGLNNVKETSHPKPENHIGAYGKQDRTGLVNLMFRNMAAKVRIGIYETIPGYKVSNVVFYKDAASGINGGRGKYDYTYSDGDVDYGSNQYHATLFANSDIFTRSGELLVKYHDKYYNTDGTEEDNVAYTAVTPNAKSSYFAFGKLTNKRGSKDEASAIAANEAIGTTSNTATMTQGNDDENTPYYTYVFPMEANTSPLELKVNYLLTATDGSGEQIRVTGANATVPAEFAKWKANYAYTYLFKISDNTNGFTNPTQEPAGLYPIVFDACVVAEEDGIQETITTINNRSITTYQNGSKVTENNEYVVKENGDIYVTVEANTAENNSELAVLEADDNIKLYTVDAPDIAKITEEQLANYANNDIILTDITSKLNISESEVMAPNTSGAQYGIKFAAKKVAWFTPVAGVAAYAIKSTIGSDISYKIIRIQGGAATKAYVLSDKTVNEGETVDMTVTNSYNGTTGFVVTGAAGAFTIADKNLTVKESATPGTYTFTANAGVAPGDHDVTLGTTTEQITVSTYSLTSASVATGSTTGTITLKLGGTSVTGKDLTITKADGSSATTADIELSTAYTITAKKAGTYTVTYLGAKSTITVVPYTLTFTDKYVNKNNATKITLANAATDACPLAVTLTPTGESATGLNTDASGISTTLTPTSATTGKLTVSYQDASASIIVKDFALTAPQTTTACNANATIADGADHVYYIKLTEKGSAVNGATFTTTGNIKVDPTSTDGVYKVTTTTGFTSDANTITYKYQGIVMQTITF